MPLKLHIYQKEYLFVLCVLVTPLLITGAFRWTEVIAVAAVFFTFRHAQIADRMQESQAAKAHPDVPCHWQSNYFFAGKEALWITFFILIHSWAALSGSIIFFCYPFWRKYYRNKHPVIVSTP